MSGTEITGDFGTLRIEQDQVDVTEAIHGPRTTFIPGRTEYFLNDVPISEDEARRLLGSR